ncbi:MAG: hypothetical protein LLG01_06080 [Planctomycetaceae bacterium]|nr:hypothetical protein [Planctomycetaceae bacterium]
MKYCLTISLLLGACLAGCGPDHPATTCCEELAIAGPESGPAVVDAWSVKAADDQAVRNAIVRQSALYPYHFEINSHLLSPLGQRDVAVLADHFRWAPGRLAMRRGDESTALYETRVQEVLDALADRGVDIKRVGVDQAPPGGDGMPSDRVFVILAADAERLATEMKQKPVSGEQP